MNKVCFNEVMKALQRLKYGEAPGINKAVGVLLKGGEKSFPLVVYGKFLGLDRKTG